MSANDYAYWQAALNGDFDKLNIAIDDPQCGFYESCSPKKTRRDAVAIWRDDDGAIVGLCGGKKCNPIYLWPSIAGRPISEETYRSVESGKGWPDSIESLVGHNGPPDDEADLDEVSSAIKAAKIAVELGVSSQLEADRLGNIRDRLAKLFQSKEKDRKAEKEPFLEGGRAVDAKFAPVLSAIESTGKLVKSALTKWLIYEDARIKKEQDEKAALERLAQEEAKALNAPAPQPVTETIESVKPRAGTMGRATGLREYKSAVVVNYATLLQSLADNSEIKALAQTLADRAARAGIALPGCEINIEKRAA